MTIAIEPSRQEIRPASIARGVLLATAGIALGMLLGGLLLIVTATRLFDFHILTVRSDSMAPSISSGDLIVVKPISIADVAVGDVILFASGGDTIPTVHRVTGINTVQVEVRDPSGDALETVTEHRLVTQGDSNPLPDASEVTAANLRGELWFTIPNGGAMAGLPIQFLLLAVAAAVTAGWFAWEVNRKREHR